MSDNKQENLIAKLLNVATTKSAQLGMYVLAATAFAAVAQQGAVDPALAAFGASFGANAFVGLLGQFATREDVSNSDLLTAIETTLDETKFTDLLSTAEFKKSLARLFERQELFIQQVISKSEA